MDISQKDRDSLRAKQHTLQASFCIGNIVEHKIQDPAKYKKVSRQEQGLSVDAQPELPKINYKSKYMNMQAPSSDTNIEMTKQDDVDMRPIEGDATSEKLKATDADLFPEFQSNLWLNMDRVEFDKLEWMSKRADQTYQEKLQSTTHFDREGIAVDPGTAATRDRDNQVHDMGSLIKLLDSTFQPQITYSLNVISKIASRATIGMYDAVFDENIHQILLKECLLRARRHLDSPNETLCLAALKCIRALIYNTQVDEIFLDKMSPLKLEEFDATIWLSSNQTEFDIELKDNECVQIDAILALVTRTDLLKRLSYLLKTKCNSQFKQAYQDCILDLLIRVARHSRGSCWMINSYDFPSLMIRDFLPNNIVAESKPTQSMALRTLKLLRILAFAASELKTLASDDETLHIKLPQEMERNITEYYHIDCYESSLEKNDLVFRLHIENLRLMKALMPLDQFPKYMFNAVTMDPTLLDSNLKLLSKLNSTQPIESPSSLDWQYAASLIDLVGCLAAYERSHMRSLLLVGKWNNYVVPITMFWWTNLIRNQCIPHQDVSIAIAAAVKHFEKESDDLLGSNKIDHAIPKRFIEERNATTINYYRKLMNEATRCSELCDILEISGRLRDPVMLPSFGFLNLNTSKEFGFSINKIAGPRTPFIILKLLTDSLHKNVPTYKETFKNHLNYRSLTLYLKNATRYYSASPNFEAYAQQSMLAQQEVCLLSRSLEMVVDYYLEPALGECEDANRSDPEATQLAANRLECYANLILDTVSLIGLINPSSDYMTDHKDKLIEKIILDNEILTRLARETYTSNHHGPELYGRLSIPGLSEKLESHLRVSQLDLDDLHMLKPIYMSCEHSGRYWLFEPLIEYYKAQLRDDGPQESNQTDIRKKTWFAENMVNGTTSYHRDNCQDSEVIGALLKLHATLMRCSPAYVEVAVKPNIEELVCLVGLVFLDSELFLSPLIANSLKRNLQIMLSRCLDVGGLFTDASHKIETLNLTLADFFNKLVDQYEASSYGDVNFSNFLLLFMSPKSDRMFKKKLFSEKAETCLSQMRMGHEEVWLPASVLDANLEKDPEVKSLIKLAGPYLVETAFLKSYRKKCISIWEDKM